MVSLWLDRKVDKKFLDLKKVLSSGNNKSTYYLHYNRPFRKDRIHAERMRGLPGVELIPYENKGHHVSKDLRDSGALDGIIRGAL
jgi:hypothetical protein